MAGRYFQIGDLFALYMKNCSDWIGFLDWNKNPNPNPIRSVQFRSEFNPIRNILFKICPTDGIGFSCLTPLTTVRSKQRSYRIRNGYWDICGRSIGELFDTLEDTKVFLLDLRDCLIPDIGCCSMLALHGRKFPFTCCTAPCSPEVSSGEFSIFPSWRLSI